MPRAASGPDRLLRFAEEEFTDFQVPNLDAVSFDMSNSCPLDQACSKHTRAICRNVSFSVERV